MWTGAVDVSRSRRGGDEKEVSDTLEPGLLIKRNIRLMPRGLKDGSIDSKADAKGSDPPIAPKRLVLYRAGLA